MVKLKVKDGQIATKMASTPGIPIYEEVGQGVVRLLVEFQVEAVRNGSPPEKVYQAFEEMMETISQKSRELAKEQIGKLGN